VPDSNKIPGLHVPWNYMTSREGRLRYVPAAPNAARYGKRGSTPDPGAPSNGLAQCAAGNTAHPSRSGH